MVTSESDGYLSGRLIQWSLRPQAIPFNEPEYRELINRYLERQDFRVLVREIASGLGLAVLAVTDRGMFLGTEDDSVFALRPGSFRAGQSSADDRLLDGLVQVAIASTIYPKQRDLDEDVIDAKPPVAVEDVDRVLREMYDAYKLAAGSEPDPESSNIERGLVEAWRVYEGRPAISMTPQGRRTANSTQGVIERNLEQLVEYGCFTADRRPKSVAYRSTLRYQVLVKELAAGKLYQCVKQLCAIHDR